MGDFLARIDPHDHESMHLTLVPVLSGIYRTAYCLLWRCRLSHLKTGHVAFCAATLIIWIVVAIPILSIGVLRVFLGLRDVIPIILEGQANQQHSKKQVHSTFNSGQWWEQLQRKYCILEQYSSIVVCTEHYTCQSWDNS